MKPRCTWSGHLKLSLVTIPVRVYNAINTSEKIAFNQLHKGCHQRIRQKLVCPVHGEVAREDLVKGYEYVPDKFVILNEAELEAVKLETTGTIDLVQFVRPEELDPMFFDTAYYLGPDGPVAEEGFAVMREAMQRSNRIGIGQVVLHGKEHTVALKPMGRGFVFFTLRYANEVRPSTPCFEGLAEKPVDADQVALARQLIESKSSPLNLTAFADRYQAELLNIIKGKLEGTQPVLVQRTGTSAAIGLMEALQKSVAEATKLVRPMARSGRRKVSLAA